MHTLCRYQSCSRRCVLSARSLLLRPDRHRYGPSTAAVLPASTKTVIILRFIHDTSCGQKDNDDARSSGTGSPTTAKMPGLHAAKHQVTHRAQETIGIKVTASVVERAAEAVERGVSKAAASKTVSVAAKQGAKAAARQAAARTAKRSARTPKFILRIFPTTIAVKRFGRGVLIAVPILGAAFSAWLARSDLRRTYKELDIARSDYKRALALTEEREAHVSTTNTDGKLKTAVSPSDQPPVLNTSTVRCFGVATAADSVNAVAHLVAAYGLYAAWAPDPIFVVESVSLAAAVISTSGAVGGEYLSAQREALREMERSGEDEDEKDGEQARGEGGAREDGDR